MHVSVAERVNVMATPLGVVLSRLLRKIRAWPWIKSRVPSGNPEGKLLTAPSAELAADVFLGELLARALEDLFGIAHLDQVAGAPALRNIDPEERGDVRDPGCLLHVVGGECDRAVFLELDAHAPDA